jgi:hypothetical protein
MVFAWVAAFARRVFRGLSIALRAVENARECESVSSLHALCAERAVPRTLRRNAEGTLRIRTFFFSVASFQRDVDPGHRKMEKVHP